MIIVQTHEKKALKVILDSNAFFVPFQFKIDIIEELKTLLKVKFELILLSPILQEIENIAKNGSQKMKRNAAMALKLTGKCRMIHVDDRLSPPDDVIVQKAFEWKCPVFTNDKELRRKLRNINVPVIYVRHKSRLEINGRI